MVNDRDSTAPKFYNQGKLPKPVPENKLQEYAESYFGLQAMRIAYSDRSDLEELLQMCRDIRMEQGIGSNMEGNDWVLPFSLSAPSDDETEAAMSTFTNHELPPRSPQKFSQPKSPGKYEHGHYHPSGKRLVQQQQSEDHSSSDDDLVAPTMVEGKVPRKNKRVNTAGGDLRPSKKQSTERKSSLGRQKKKSTLLSTAPSKQAPATAFTTQLPTGNELELQDTITDGDFVSLMADVAKELKLRHLDCFRDIAKHKRKFKDNY